MHKIMETVMKTCLVSLGLLFQRNEAKQLAATKTINIPKKATRSTREGRIRISTKAFIKITPAEIASHFSHPVNLARGGVRPNKTMVKTEATMTPSDIDEAPPNT